MWKQSNMSLESRLLRQIKRMTKVLFLSGFLNIVLLTVVVYYFIKDHFYIDDYDHKPVQIIQESTDSSNSMTEVLINFKKQPFNALINELEDSTLIENGYTKRDLALASLVSYYFFNIEQALPGMPLQRRQLIFQHFDKSYKITIFPGLSSKQYQLLIRYASTERWPLNSQGLFLLLHREKELGIIENSLAEAFYLTQEFLSVEELFHRVDISKEILLSILLSGDWQMLASFSQQQKISKDLSSSKREKLLLDYIAKGSKEAAYVMLQTDRDFATKKLNDDNTIIMLELLQEKTPEAKLFALDLLISPRSDRVWQKAAHCLYKYYGEEMPMPYDHMTSLSRFVTRKVTLYCWCFNVFISNT